MYLTKDFEQVLRSTKKSKTNSEISSEKVPTEENAPTEVNAQITTSQAEHHFVEMVETSINSGEEPKKAESWIDSIFNEINESDKSDETELDSLFPDTVNPN